MGKGGDFTSVKFSENRLYMYGTPYANAPIYALTPMLSHVLAEFLRLRALFECCMKTRAEHADFDPLIGDPPAPLVYISPACSWSCVLRAKFRCVRQHAPHSFGALDHPVQSHELAHDPAARSWPRPRARGARHLWTLCSDATAFSRTVARSPQARTPGDDRTASRSMYHDRGHDRTRRCVRLYNEPELCWCVKGCCHFPYNEG